MSIVATNKLLVLAEMQNVSMFQMKEMCKSLDDDNPCIEIVYLGALEELIEVLSRNNPREKAEKKVFYVDETDEFYLHLDAMIGDTIPPKGSTICPHYINSFTILGHPYFEHYRVRTDIDQHKYFVLLRCEMDVDGLPEEPLSTMNSDDLPQCPNIFGD